MPDVNRKKLVKNVKRVVVKIGSGVLTRRNGLNLNVIDDLTTEICFLRKKGIEVIMVSSGAIAAGLRKIGMSKKPDSLSGMQALAAMGQSNLSMVYEEAFARHGAKAAQILLTRDDLTNRRRYLNSRNTILRLLSWKIIPVINENDTVVVDEIKFGDNDNLSGMVTNLTDSRLLVNLTNIDGLFDRDPRTNKDAELIKVVAEIDEKIINAADKIPGSLGRGGMASKITAAQKMMLRGIPTIVANGLKPGILKDIFSGREVGTFFLPHQKSLGSKKHWIAFTKSPKGKLVIDKGAEKALLENGKSLLPSGIKAIQGRFNRGNAVILINEDAGEVAVGLVNYSSDELNRILGVKTSQIESLLGYKHDDEIIHRDNLVISLYNH